MDDKSNGNVDKLTEKNYRAWSTTIRAILRGKKIFGIVDGTELAPLAPVGTDANNATKVKEYEEALEKWEMRSANACAILLSTITGRLITYVEDVDDPARMWTILKHKYAPVTDISLAQALKHLIMLRMAEDGNMEAHTRDFIAAKRRIEEHSITLDDIVYRIIFLLSMPTGYQMAVTALEGQANLDLEAVQNRLLEEYRKRQMGGEEVVMSALLTNHSKSNRHKAGKNGSSGNKAKLRCTHCQKSGHVESTC